MQAGQLRHRVTLQQKSVTRDTDGAEIVSWVTLATVWAAVEPLRGREFFEAQQTQAEATFRVRLRYRSDVTSDMRVLWGSQALEIVAPPQNVDGRSRELHLLCREVT